MNLVLNTPIILLFPFINHIYEILYQLKFFVETFSFIIGVGRPNSLFPVYFNSCINDLKKRMFIKTNKHEKSYTKCCKQSTDIHIHTAGKE